MSGAEGVKESGSNKDETSYDDEEWIDMTDNEFLQAYPILTTDDKLDEDYIMYVQYAIKLAEKGESYADFPKFKAWLEKLITEPANNVERKRTRNIYLTQLLLQLKEGRLQGTLADMPPEGSLIPAKEVFTSLNLPPTKTAHDLEMETALDLTNLRYVSKDGRTYLATKSLDKDSGVCGYLAVSIGEESKGLWLDSRGRPRQLEKGSNNMAENVPNTSPVTDDAKLEEQTISVLLQKRLSEEDRLKLKKFYEDVLARIDKILKSANQGKEKMEIKDPVIKEMIERIKCETPTVGNVLCAPADFHGLTLLKALRKKVICKLEDIQDRSNLIECISKQVAYQGKEPYKIVDLSKKISDPLANNVWKNVQIYRPAKSDSISLIATYGERLVQALLCLFDHQKQIIFEQEYHAHQETMASYRNALIEDVRDYVEKYLISRNEWHRVHEALKSVKAIQKEAVNIINKEMGNDEASTSDRLNAKFITSAIVDLEEQINDAKKVSEILKKEYNDILGRITTVKSNYRKVYDKLQQMGEQRKNTICSLKIDIQAQERKINELEHCLSMRKQQQEQCS